MSSSPDAQAAWHHQDARAPGVEVLAVEFVAFVEEFEAALSEGQVSPAFAERLAQFLQSAERII